MTSIDISYFTGMGDSPWWRYQLVDNHSMPVSISSSAPTLVYEPNISPVLGNRGIEVVKTGEVVAMLPHGKRMVVSTVQEPISREGSFPYHENVNIPERLYSSCLRHGIDHTRICYASGDYFADDLQASPIKTMFVPGWNHLFWEHGRKAMLKGNPKDRRCTNTFLSFNRIHKPHRMYFVLRLRQLGLLSGNLVSCADSIDGASFVEHFEWIRNDKLLHEAAYDPHGLVDVDELAAESRLLQHSLPLILDVSDFQGNGCYEDDTFWSSMPFYQNSFMSVVTESNAFGPGCYISEAIFRPFVFMHPFMVIGQPRTLSVLREWGFDTFDDVFDNSYDSEPDMFKRTEMVLSQIMRFHGMSRTDLDRLTVDLMPRLEYNRDRYFGVDFKGITRSYLEKITGWADEN